MYGSIIFPSSIVEFELGLFDEASEKFAKASQMNTSDVPHMASYGFGLALLSIARRNLQDGKLGAAMDAISRAIECCATLDDEMACSLKLLGDLHSFVANLPPDVIPVNDSDETHSLANQLKFISKGVEYYRKAERIIDASVVTEDRSQLMASLQCDLGCNFLSQGQLVAHAAGHGLGLPFSDADSLFLQAEESFTQALDLHAEYAPAWCGLGCSVRRRDPLLSQHAFCRSIELDSLSHEAYTNLAFLYTFNNLPDPSQIMSDAVTRVADTPFMWINRALLASRQAKHDQVATGDVLLRQAADAYRAALQVSITSTAKEGLALTCRIGSNTHRSQSEMHYLLSEYMQLTGRANIPACIFHGLSAMELERECHEGGTNVAKAEDGLLKLQVLAEHTSETIDSLDVSAIAAALSELKLDCETDSSFEELTPINARSVFYQPDRGDYWLQMAKRMLKQDDPSLQQLRTAQRACSKARQILADDSMGGISTADDLSDALVLECLLHQLCGDAPGENAAVSIQKARLLNPGNTFARQVLC